MPALFDGLFRLPTKEAFFFIIFIAEEKSMTFCLQELEADR
jgi:hypothetical protein